jgi:hypothetical protein
MVTTAQYITVTTQVPVTMQLPKKIYSHTNPQTLDHCLNHFYRIAHNAMEFNGHIFPLDTLHLVAEAMVDGGAITVLYTNEKGEISARTIFPHSITLTEDNHLITHGYCTFRREERSFRLDKMRCTQLVTTPAEAAPAQV